MQINQSKLYPKICFKNYYYRLLCYNSYLFITTITSYCKIQRAKTFGRNAKANLIRYKEGNLLDNEDIVILLNNSKTQEEDNSKKIKDEEKKRKIFTCNYKRQCFILLNYTNARNIKNIFKFCNNF